MTEYLDFWLHYADFSGKTNRRGFWLAMVFNALLPFLILIAVSIILVLAFHTDVEKAVQIVDLLRGLYGLAILIPLLSITVRRLRDAGYSAKSFFWLLVPVFGGIAFIARLCTASAQQTDPE